MRGKKQGQISVACLLDVEQMIPPKHPIRAIKGILNVVLGEMDSHFVEMYAEGGRPSIPPERLLLSKVLMALYSIRSERQFCERLQYDLLFRWFLDLNPDEPVFDHSTFSQNQGRLLAHQAADQIGAAILRAAAIRPAFSLVFGSEPGRAGVRSLDVFPEPGSPASAPSGR